MALTSRLTIRDWRYHHVQVPKMSAYARLKRYREGRSLERERQYLAKDWQALGTEPEKLDGSTVCLAKAPKARVYRPTVGAGKA